MLVDPQFSQQQGREVTTYLVSPRGGGALHCSIQQAIDKAEPYSRIAVQAGTYYESVNITHPIELVGEDGILPELVCRGIGITVAVDIECYIENMKVLAKGQPTVNNTQTQIRGTNASVRIVAGMPTFVQCELTSIYVGGTANPTFCNCSITGSIFSPGITVAEYASGSYRNNVVSNHVPFCVVVSSKGEPKFEDNEFSQNSKAIHHAIQHAGAVNTATGHSGVVLVTREGRDMTRNIQPEFISNSLRDDVLDSSTASPTTFAKRHVFGSSFDFARDFAIDRCCIRVDQTCTPTFHENNIVGGVVGILVRTGAGGAFQDNSIYGSTEFGVVLNHESFPTFRINTVSRCATGLLAEGTAALLVHNTIRDNAGAGMLLLVGPKDNFRLEGNSFVANDTGIVVRPSVRKHATDDAMKAWIERQHRIHGRESGVESAMHGGDDDAPAAEGNPVRGGDGRSPAEPGDLTSSGRRASVAPDGKQSPNDGDEKKSAEQEMDLSFDASGPSLGAAKRAPPGTLKGTRVEDMERYSCIIGQTVMSHNRCCGVAFMAPTYPVLLTEADVLHNGQVGALVSHGASPTIRGVRFEKGPVGVRIERSGRPVVKQCTFLSHLEAAVLVTEHGRGRILRNIIAGFQGGGVVVEDASDPVVRENAIRQSAGIGIHVLNGGIGRFVKNTIASVAYGIEVRSFGDPLMEENDVQNCAEMGVYVRDEGIGTFIDNLIARCHIGIGVAAQGEPTLRRNTIERCVSVGAILSAGSRAVVEKNTFESSSHGNVLLEGADSDSIVRGNIVRKSPGFGIRSARGGGGTVVKNFVTDNGDGGLSSEGGGRTLFEDNVVTNESGSGIKVLDKGASVFRNNTISAAQGAGIELCSKSAATVENCVVARCAKAGLRLHPHCGGTVRDCHLRLNDQGGVLMVGSDCETHTTLRGLTIEANKGPGVFAERAEASVTMQRCTIQGHEVGMELKSAGKSRVVSCNFKDNRRAVVASMRGVATLQDCLFTESTEVDIDFFLDGDARVSHCRFELSPIGVLGRQNGRGEVMQCRFFANQTAGAMVASGASTLFTKNRFVGCNTAMLGALGGAGSFGLNIVQHSMAAAAIASLIADASRYASNTVLHSCGHGILAEAGSHATFLKNVVRFSLRSAVAVLLPHTDFDSALSTLRRDEAGMKLRTTVPTGWEPELLMPTRPGPSMSPATSPRKRPGPPGPAADETQSDGMPTLPLEEPGGNVTDPDLEADPDGPGSGDDESDDVHADASTSVVPPLPKLDPTPAFDTPFGLDRKELLGKVTRACGLNTEQVRKLQGDGSAAKAIVVKMQRLAFTSLVKRGKHPQEDSSADVPLPSSPVKGAKGKQGKAADKDADAPACGMNFMDNYLCDSTDSGVVVLPLVPSTAVGFFGNTVERNASSGVYVHAKARPFFSNNNTIAHNNNCGLIVAEFGEPDFRGSIVRANAPCNVRLVDNSGGRISGNFIDAGDPHGVMVSASRAVFNGNFLADHRATGTAMTFLSEAPDFLAEENTFEGNANAIAFDGINACAQLRRNKIANCNGTGCRFATGTRPILHENVFSGCTVGVAIDYDSAGELVGNRFARNQQGVVVVGEGVAVKILKNTFEANGCGLALRGNETLTIEANDFFDHEESAVHADDGSRTRIVKNSFTGNKVGVLSTAGSVPRVFRNRFSDCEVGVKIRPGSGGLLEKDFLDRCSIGVLCQSANQDTIVALACIFSSCVVAGWCSEGSGSPSRVSHSLFTRCRDTAASCGILLRDNGGGNFIDCDIHLNSVGVLAQTGASGEVSRCQIHDNATCGFEAASKSITALTSCLLFKHRVADVLVHGTAAPIIKRCTIKAVSRGVVLGRDASGVVAQNIIRDATFGVLVSGCASASVSGNLITNCATGVQVTPGASAASITGNHVLACGHGVNAAPASKAELGGNLVYGCEFGVIVEAGSFISMRHNGIFKSAKVALLLRGRGGSVAAFTRIGESPTAIGVGCYLPLNGPALPYSPDSVADSQPPELKSPATDSSSFAANGPEPSITELAALPPSAAVEATPAGAVPRAVLYDTPLPKSILPVPAEALAQPPPQLADILMQEPHAVVESDVGRCDHAFLQHSGRTIVRKCLLHDSEVGLAVSADTSAVVDSNIVFDNARVGLKLSSRDCEIHGNEFVSKDAGSAVEPLNETYQVPQGNTVMNQTAIRAPAVQSHAPTKAADLPSAVPNKGRDVSSAVQTTLLTVHRQELPDFIPCGCSAIPGSTERSKEGTANIFNFALDGASGQPGKALEANAAAPDLPDGSLKSPDSGALSPEPPAVQQPVPPKPKPAGKDMGGASARKKSLAASTVKSPKPPPKAAAKPKGR